MALTATSRLPILTCMGMVSKAPLVRRLWITLSLLSLAFSAIALGTYTWLAVWDSIDAAESQTYNKFRVIEQSRFILPGSEPLPQENALATELGVKNLRLYITSGRELAPARFGALTAADLAEEQDLFDSATAGKSARRTVAMNADRYVASSISPLDVIRGGTFGEQFVVVKPAPELPGGFIRMTFIVQYPDVSAGAWTIIKRSAIVALVIVSGLIVGTWLLLRLFVTRPLRSLSQTALRIAGGDSTRIDAKGGDEISELGRALNGMADALQHQATVDSLTGLYNLRHLSSNLDALIGEARKARQPLSVIVGDLDNLKPINDTYGHGAGDSLLRAVGETLGVWAGRRFTCWRVGGDEFAIAMPYVAKEEAMAHAAELRRRVGGIQLAVRDVHGSISVGVASYPDDGESAAALLAAADRRMYLLKAQRPVRMVPGVATLPAGKRLA